MSKGKTAICVCAMVASCVTGGVLIADCAVSGNTVGKMDNQEVFSFENQKLANAMPTFTAPIGENTAVITADTAEYSIEEVPAVNSECIVETMTKELTAIYTETQTTETILTEEAVTVITDSTVETPVQETVTTAVTTAVTVTTTTTTVSSSEETTTTTTTTTTAPAPETVETTVAETFTEPVEWFYMETQPAVQVMATEPVYTEPAYTEPVAVAEETVVEEPVYEEPEVTYTSGTAYISESDYILLCNAVAHEAGSDWIDVYSKANVVEVIMNRVYSPLFPNSVYEVLSQPYQFEGSETYTSLNTYSYQVTDSVISAVDLYFNEPSSFLQGYLYFFGDGYQNYFSVAQ